MGIFNMMVWCLVPSVIPGTAVLYGYSNSDRAHQSLVTDWGNR